MEIYLELFGLITCFSLIEIYTSKKMMLPVFWAVIAILIVFVGLRGYEVGFDYLTYKESFEEIGSGTGEDILMEPGYMLLNKLLYPFGSFTLLLFVMALVTISIKGYFIAEYSEYPFTSLLVYFSIAMLINDMGQIRFGLAISFMMLSFSALIKEHKKTAFLFWLAAMMFHYSSFLALPVLFVNHYTLTAKQVTACLLFGLCFYLVSINTILTAIASFMPSHIAGKIHFYTFYADTYGQSLGINISLFLRLFILGLFFYYKDSLAEEMKDINSLFNLYLYGVLIYMIFNSNAEFATRGSAYFKILELVILPAFIKLGKKRSDQLLIWGAVVAYAFYSLSKILFDTEFGEPYHHYTNVLF